MDRRQLTQRTAALIEGLRGRLDEAQFDWASEFAGQTEWELALATVHHAASAGKLRLTDEEAEELFALEAQVDRRLMRDLLRPKDGVPTSGEPPPDRTIG